MGVLGLWAGILRGILGLSRGVAGVFCREIPGFLGGARARHGNSAHGGQWRALGAKKFLKKGRKTEKLGCERCQRRSERTLYRVCGVIFRRDF